MLKKFYHEFVITQSHFHISLLIPVLLLLPPRLQLLSPLKCGTLQSHPWGLESAASKLLFMLIFWPLPLNHWCFSWWMVIPFQKFLVYFAQIHQRNHCLWQLYEIFFLNNKNWKWKWFLIHGLQNGYCISRWEQHNSHCTPPLELLHDQTHYQWAVTFTFWKEFFLFRVVDLNSELKISSKPCCQHPSFVVPFIEHSLALGYLVFWGW